MLDEFKKDVSQWILDWVSVPNDTFGTIPCPYASAALVVGHVDWKFASDEAELFRMLDITQSDLVKPVLIIGMERTSITPESLSRCINDMNKTLMYRGLVALEDHPDDVEIVNSTVMNQGKWVMIMIQSLSKLNAASESLKAIGYYDSWTKEELDDVVSWRFKRQKY